MDHFSGRFISLVQVALLLAAAGPACTGARINGGDWTRPFDGMTLDGWEVRGGFARYNVENREIIGTTVKGHPVGRRFNSAVHRMGT